MKIFSIGLLALILMVTIFVGVFAKNKKEEAPMFKYTNKLADEKSPYLLQHAHNPVNWRPWGDEAFAKAAAEDKPIFLSIGYSTCHWCHVMEHESFEDEQVAKLMNDSFVAIKVDREERPDIDNVYMTVCQMMTGSGGWPLTIIMTPDKKPFFAGTYIPKQSRYGRMGMMELLPRVSELWKTDRQRLLQSADEIVGHLSNSTAEQAGNDLDAALLDRTFKDLAGRYDDRLGGFGDAPKFPTPHNLLFLMRHYQRTGDAEALQMVVKTLSMMRRGGVYDQIGFGFHRYSTDRQWLLPHFEKMIYDQAMLILAYSEAWQLTGDNEFAQTAQEIIEYVLRDMTAPEGGFYSAEDADSDGEEGKFYVWTKQELDDLLGADAEWFEALFNVAPGGNFSDQATGQKTGGNILHRQGSLKDFAAAQRISLDELNSRIKAARQKLFAVREKRIHPHKDDKVLTDWNGLMIAALAKAGRIFDAPEYTAAAEKAAAFIAAKMIAPRGRLLHRYRDGDAAIRAYVDDYAFYAWGLIELFETTQQADYLKRALDASDVLVADFGDEKTGGFFTTPADGEKLLIRNKEIYDGAMPSGNSVAMLNFIRLARITGREEFETRAQQIGAAFSQSVERSPSAYTFLMSALSFAAGPAYEIVVVGDAQAQDVRAMMRALNDRYLPNSVVVLRNTRQPQHIDALSSFVQGYEAIDGKATAYVCQSFACQLPTASVEKMLKLLPSISAAQK